MKPKITVGFIIAVLCIHLHQESCAQSDIIFKNYTVAEGLSSNSVLALLQDRKGFIWVGTEDGLNRFDGYKFRGYKNIPNDSTSLEFNIISQLLEDKKGLLWIRFGNGVLNCLNQTSDQVIQSRSLTRKYGWEARGVSSIYIDRDNNTWISYLDGRLIVLDTLKKLKATVLLANGSPPGPVTNFNIIGNTKFWLHNNQDYTGFSVSLPMEVKRTDGLNIISATEEPLSRTFHPVLSQKDGSIFITTKFSLYLLSANGDTLRKFPINGVLRGGAISNNSKIWIGSHDGLFVIDMRDSSLLHIRYKGGDPHSLPMAYVNCILSDHQGNVWAGTYGGISKIDFWKHKFMLIQIPPDHPDGITSNRIRSIVTDKFGGIWMGVEPFGLLRYHNGVIRNYEYFQKGLEEKKTMGIRSMKIEDDTLYFNAWQDGFNKASIREILNGSKTRKIKPLSIFANSESVSCFDIMESRLMWVGSIQGLKRISPDGKASLIDISRFSAKRENTMYIGIRCMYPESDSILWLGSTSNGIYRVKYKKEKEPEIRHFLPDSTSPNGIGNNTINCIISLGENIWFSTYGGGLFKLNKKSWKYRQYTTANGLPNNVIYGIVNDSRGFLWLSSNRGIIRFDPQHEVFSSYSPSDGLQGYEYNSGAWAKDKEGTIFFGGTNGLNWFRPDSIVNNTYEPHILFTGFQIMNRNVFPGDLENYKVDLNFTSKLNLLPGQNTFSFEFSATNYINSEKNQYAYMLEGLDTSWQFIGNRRFISFTTIPPGTYTLNLRASNNDDKWSTHVRKLKIIIAPFYYETGIFKAGIWMLSLGTLSSLFYFIIRVRKVKRKEQQRLRNQLKKDLHDDLKSDLSAIQNQAELIEMVLQKGDQNKAKMKAEEIAYLTRNALSTVDDLSWAFGTSGDTLAEVSGRMKNFIISIMPDSINYEISAPNEFEKATLPFLCKKHFYLIFKECIQNMKRHSSCTKATIEWGLREKVLYLMIVDNGKGFDQDQLMHKNGLLHMMERAKDAGGVLAINSRPGSGTQIHLEIPIT